MATNLEEICAFLENQKLHYHRSEPDNHILTGFETENYENKHNENILSIVIALEEDGEFIKIFSPNCYVCNDPKLRPSVLQTLLMVSWKTKMIQFEFNEADGEIRSMIEFPLEDALLTEKQLMRAIQGLVQIIDKFHTVISKALTEGIIDFPQEGTGDFSVFMKHFEAYLHELGIGEESIDTELDDDESSSTDDMDYI